MYISQKHSTKLKWVTEVTFRVAMPIKLCARGKSSKRTELIWCCSSAFIYYIAHFEQINHDTEAIVLDLSGN